MELGEWGVDLLLTCIHSANSLQAQTQCQSPDQVLGMPKNGVPIHARGDLVRSKVLTHYMQRETLRGSEGGPRLAGPGRAKGGGREPGVPCKGMTQKKPQCFLSAHLGQRMMGCPCVGQSNGRGLWREDAKEDTR